VRVRFLEDFANLPPLRTGLSASVSVDLQSTPTTAAAASN